MGIETILSTVTCFDKYSCSFFFDFLDYMIAVLSEGNVRKMTVSDPVTNIRVRFESLDFKLLKFSEKLQYIN